MIEKIQYDKNFIIASKDRKPCWINLCKIENCPVNLPLTNNKLQIKLFDYPTQYVNEEMLNKLNIEYSITKTMNNIHLNISRIPKSYTIKYKKPMMKIADKQLEKNNIYCDTPYRNYTLNVIINRNTYQINIINTKDECIKELNTLISKWKKYNSSEFKNITRIR